MCLESWSQVQLDAALRKEDVAAHKGCDGSTLAVAIAAIGCMMVVLIVVLAQAMESVAAHGEQIVILPGELVLEQQAIGAGARAEGLLINAGPHAGAVELEEKITASMVVV